MTQNKFWLVWNESGNAPKKPHDTQEKAIIEAKRLASMYPQHDYIVLEATHSFKADVNIIETSFGATPEELKLIPKTEYRKKFNNGDLVKIEHSDDAFKIIACGGSFTKEYTGNVYDIQSIKDGKIYRAINECNLMPEESSDVKTSLRFDMGDIVQTYFSNERFKILEIKDSFVSLISLETGVITNSETYLLNHATIDKTSAVEPKFKIGDRVLLDNYYECIVDDYIDETKSYKLSLMGGGYNIANKIRVTKR